MSSIEHDPTGAVSKSPAQRVIVVIRYTDFMDILASRSRDLMARGLGARLTGKTLGIFRR